MHEAIAAVHKQEVKRKIRRRNILLLWPLGGGGGGDVGIMEGCSSIGSLLGPLLGGSLFFEVGFRNMFLIMVAPFVGLLLILVSGVAIPSSPSTTIEAGTAEGEKEGATNTIENLIETNGGEQEGHDTIIQQGLPSSSITTPPPSQTKRLYKALTSSPTLPTYICIVLHVSATLGFTGATLSEHFVLSLGVSSFEAGFLYILQTAVYIAFSFFAAPIAHRVGEWKAILAALCVWSMAMLTLGPLPPLHIVVHKHIGAFGVIAGSLGVLGAVETFIFLPFVPVFYSRFTDRLGWEEEEAEDMVAGIYATTWGLVRGFVCACVCLWVGGWRQLVFT